MEAKDESEREHTSDISNEKLVVSFWIKISFSKRGRVIF